MDLRSPTAIHPALTNPDNLPLPRIEEDPTSKSEPQSPVKLNGMNCTSSIGNSLLREYAHQLGPLNTADYINGNDQLASLPMPTSVGDDTSNESTASVPSSPLTAKAPRSFQAHRKNALSVESIPRQTIMKALASSGRNHNPQNLSIASTLSSMIAAQNGGESRPGTASSQKLSAALSDLAMSALKTSTPGTARFPALQSPCFYHQRFDDAVNIDRVLEEIKGDEWMSHSRLMQTATGVREVSKQLQRRPIKRAVRSVMIVTKARDNNLVSLTRELAEWLLSTPRYGSDLGVNVYVDAKLRNSKRFGAASLLESEPRFQHMLKYWTPDLCWSQPEKFDLVLTLGGDGTVLFTSWLFQRIVPPILSFSLGSLGFLTNFEFDNFKEHLNKIMGDDGMRVNLRMRFTCTVYRDGVAGQEMEEGEQFEVLNELVIDRGPSPYVSNLELYGDNELLTVIQADGCIFSTPTGEFSIYFAQKLYTKVCWQVQQLTPCPLVALWSILTFRPFYLPLSVPILCLSGPWSSQTAFSFVFLFLVIPVPQPTAPLMAKAASSSSKATTSQLQLRNTHSQPSSDLDPNGLTASPGPSDGILEARCRKGGMVKRRTRKRKSIGILTLTARSMAVRKAAVLLVLYGGR
jgi:NAD+ kinase